MEEQKVVWVDPQNLYENEVTNNLYSLNPENLESIKENIDKFGILEPLIVDSDNVIISGNIRLRVALEIGLEKVPVIYEVKSKIDAKLIAVSHAQQRMKTYSEILKEYKILEAEYPVGKGCRTDLHPEIKKNQAAKKHPNISRSKTYKLKNIEKYGKELYGEDSEKYKKLWEAIDTKEVSLNALCGLIRQSIF